MKITSEMLMMLGACDEQTDRFTEAFPFGVPEVTEELCVRHADDFEWCWAVGELLGDGSRDFWYDETGHTDQSWREARRPHYQRYVDATRHVQCYDLEGRRIPGSRELIEAERKRYHEATRLIDHVRNVARAKAFAEAVRVQESDG